MAAITDSFVPIDPNDHFLRKIDHPKAAYWKESIQAFIQELAVTPLPENSPLKEREISISFTCREEDEVLQVMLACYPDSAENGGEMVLKVDNEERRFFLEPEITEAIKERARSDGCELNMVRYLVDGHEYEFINWVPGIAKDCDFWNPGWKKAQGEFYQEVAYPLVLIYLNELTPKNAKIMEICAGDGQFAEMALAHVGGNIAHYRLLDLNKPSCLEAENRLSEQIKKGSASVHEADLTKTDFLNLAKGTEVDLILGIGALTRDVLKDRETALKVLDETVKALKRGGRLILTGLADQWICAEDLRQRGFTVENTSSPYHDLQFYVARKN